jgi:hypothetical protein
MKKISQNNYNTAIDSIVDAMSEEEYRKAVMFYRFLVGVTKCSNGILSIDREKFIDIAAAYMKCSPIEAYNILRKMKAYDWIRIWDKDYVVINLDAL